MKPLLRVGVAVSAAMELIRKWTPLQVSDWMRGLDECLQPYVSSLQLQGVSGAELLGLSHTELQSLGMTRVGHQEALLEAVDLLRAMNSSLEGEQMKLLQSQMNLAHLNLSKAVSRRRKSPSYQNKSSALPPNDFLSAVVELISAAKGMLGNLDRPDLSDTKSKIIHLCLQLTSTVQKDCTVFEMEEKILEVSSSLKSLCEKTTSDPSRICVLEEVTLRDIQPGQGLGIYIKSTYEGLHMVTGTTENSAADQSGRIQAGDEVLQVNGQTVVGWTLQHLVDRLRAESGTVVLMLKKKKETGSGSTAALKNPRWRPPLVKTSQPSGPGPRPGPRSGPEQSEESPKRGAAILDLYIPPPPPLSEAGSSSPLGPRSPRSPHPCLDVDRPFSCSEPAPSVTSDPSQTLELPVRLRPRSSARSKARPVSMPVDLSSRIYSRKGLQRCLSNERVSAILEEDGFPVPYRVCPRGVQGVDHIRGSQSFISNGGGARTQTRTRTETRTQTRTESRPGTRTKPSSLLGSWFARLRLLSH